MVLMAAIAESGVFPGVRIKRSVVIGLLLPTFTVRYKLIFKGLFVKSNPWLTAALSASVFFVVGTAQAGQWVLMTFVKSFAFDDCTVNIGLLDLRRLDKSIATGHEGTVFQLFMWIDVENTSDRAETFISRDDLKVIVGGDSFSDISSQDHHLKDLTEIEPGTTQLRAGLFYIPKALVNDPLIIRAKNHDIKVHVFKLGRSLPQGCVLYGGPED